MNNNRTDFVWPDREFNITPNWLLGFVEGDGSFSVRRNPQSKYNLIFSISQSATYLALLIAIQNYLNGLVVSSSKILPIKSNIKHIEGIRNFVILSSSTNKKILTPNKKYNLSVVDEGPKAPRFVSELLSEFAHETFIF